ncbi:MAG: DNA polymerase III subunit delta', partial [Phycisphaerae bacterium]
SWLAAQGVEQPEVALAQASGAPLLAQALAAGDELAGRRECLRLLADSGFDPIQTAELMSDLGIERFAGWLLRWTSDLVEQRLLGRIRFNPDFAQEIAVLARHIDPLSALR